MKARVAFGVRRLAWLADPFLAATRRNAEVIFAAGSWVERRLRVVADARVVRMTQLGVDAGVFTTAGRPAVRNLLVHAGRLDWIKGLDLAIEALAVLPEDFQLLLIGTGPAESKLRDWARTCGVAARVEFRKPVPRRQLSVVYGDARVFVFPSAEAGGLAWIEALACGLPVVGIRGSNALSEAQPILEGAFVAEVAHDRKSTISNFAAMILHAVTSSPDRELIARTASEKFSWDTFAGRVASAYNDCMESHL